MKFLSLLAWIGALYLGAIMPVCAKAGYGRSADMFYDRSWLYNRPPVRSDAVRGSDMFKPVPPMFSPNADMFKGTVKANPYGREDMFRYRRVVQIPHHTLVIDPPQGPYNAR